MRRITISVDDHLADTFVSTLMVDTLHATAELPVVEQ